MSVGRRADVRSLEGAEECRNRRLIQHGNCHVVHGLFAKPLVGRLVRMGGFSGKGEGRERSSLVF